jgi:hypothetical protein
MVRIYFWSPVTKKHHWLKKRDVIHWSLKHWNIHASPWEVDRGGRMDPTREIHLIRSDLIWYKIWNNSTLNDLILNLIRSDTIRNPKWPDTKWFDIRPKIWNDLTLDELIPDPIRPDATQNPKWSNIRWPDI